MNRLFYRTGLPRPADAEELDASKFFKAYDMPSKLLPGCTQRVWRLHCPQCSAVQKEPYGVSRCECGLSMDHDLSLYVWHEKEHA